MSKKSGRILLFLQVPLSMQAGIKASLTTLELVHASNHSDNASLSNDEVEAAHRSLDEITRMAASIKEKLPSSLLSASADKDMNDIDESVDESSSQSSISSLPNAASVVAKTGILKKKPPDDYDEPSTNDDHQPHRRLSIGRIASTNDDHQPQRRLSIGQINTTNDEPQRRLSIGQIDPMNDAAETQDTASKQGKPRQKQGVSFFSRGHNTVHPVDIETGSNSSRPASSGGVRRNRFSKAVQRKDSEPAGTWKMTAREAFRIIDENGDGFLQKEEVVRAIEMMVEHGEMGLDGMTSIELAEKMMSEVE